MLAGLSSCGDEPGDLATATTAPSSVAETPATTTNSVATTSTDPANSVVVSVDELFDGEGPRSGVFGGAVIWDNASARLCEAIMESFPPQCGGMWVVIADPTNLSVELDEAGGVKWTPGFVELEATFDGSRLQIVDGWATPTADDQAIADALLRFTADPGPATVAALPFANEVSLALGAETIVSLDSEQVADPAAWIMNRDEYDGYAGPFSVLETLSEPVEITIGAHNRCVARPTPAPGDVAGLRQVGMQPTDATSCLEWFAVDLFVNDAGEIESIRLDLYGP